MQITKRNRLSDIIRAKIAVQLTLNPKNTHQEIADFYGISRQLVTLIAKEYGCERTLPKGKEGSETHPNRTRANFQAINEKFSELNTEKLLCLAREIDIGYLV
jgi:hypothetical protein